LARLSIFERPISLFLPRDVAPLREVLPDFSAPAIGIDPAAAPTLILQETKDGQLRENVLTGEIDQAGSFLSEVVHERRTGPPWESHVHAGHIVDHLSGRHGNRRL
jgi:hypothetical protein